MGEQGGGSVGGELHDDQDVKAKERIEHELLKGLRCVSKTLELVQLGLQCLDLGEESVLARLDACVNQRHRDWKKVSCTRKNES